MSVDMNLVPKAKTSSPIWIYFGFEPDENGSLPKDENKAVCRLCAVVVRVVHGNTTNLMNHLKIHHIAKYSQIKKPVVKSKREDEDDINELPIGKQPKIASAIQKSLSYDQNSSRWKEITRSITCYIAGEAMPIYTVQKDHFIKMVKVFDSHYNLPSRNYFSKESIPKLYNEVRERVESELQEVNYFSATTDMWSSIGMTPYMGFTVHYINKAWELKSRSLQTLFFPCDHTGENITDGLLETLEAWSLKSEKLSCIATDNGANVFLAVNGVLGWPRISCFGHNLNLAVTNSYKKDTRVTRALSVCRTIVSAFSYSWKRRREMAKMQKELSIPQHQLIADCATRWGSAHAMTTRFLEQASAVRKVLSEDRKCAHLIPRYNDMQVLEAIKAAFDPVSNFTDILSAEKYVTISQVKPLLYLLENQILDSADDIHTLTTTLKDNIRAYIANKYSDTKTMELLV